MRVKQLSKQLDETVEEENMVVDVLKQQGCDRAEATYFTSHLVSGRALCSYVCGGKIGGTSLMIVILV